MQDTELVALCKTIYSRHREAIDLIVQYGSASEVLDAVQVYLSRSSEFKSVRRTGSYVYFVPVEMAACQPESITGSWEYPVMFWYHFDKRLLKLHICMEVGPVGDSALRIRLMHAIQEGGLPVNEKLAFRDDAKYTRIKSAGRKLKEGESGTVDDDPEKVQELAGKLWDTLWPEINPIVDILKAFDWKA